MGRKDKTKSQTINKHEIEGDGELFFSFGQTDTLITDTNSYALTQRFFESGHYNSESS